MIKNRKGTSGVEGGKGTCYQWKEKDQCSRGDRCSFRHETQDRAQKPEHTAATPSEPSSSRGRSVLKKRCIRGKSNHGANLQQPCRLFERYLHAIALQILASARVPILPKPKRVAKAGDKSLFPHHKVDEQPNKKPKKDYCSHKRREKRRQECCGYRENCTAIGLRLARLGVIGFSKRQTVPGKTDAKSLAIDSKSTVHSVYTTSSKYPGKERTIALKIQVKNRHQRRPNAMKFKDGSHEETERQQRCARSKAWNLAKTETSSKRTTMLHSTRPRKNGYTQLRQQRSWRKESL